VADGEGGAALGGVEDERRAFGQTEESVGRRVGAVVANDDELVSGNGLAEKVGHVDFERRATKIQRVAGADLRGIGWRGERDVETSRRIQQEIAARKHAAAAQAGIQATARGQACQISHSADTGEISAVEY